MILTVLIGWALLIALIVWFVMLILGIIADDAPTGFHIGLFFAVPIFLFILAIGLIGWI